MIDSDKFYSDLPRRWSENTLSVAYELSYITKEELKLLSNFFPEQVIYYGPYGIQYLSIVEIIGYTFSLEKTATVPFLYRSGQEHFLFYLTPEQQYLLIEKDVHNAGLKENKFYGPDNIPIYSTGDGSIPGGGKGYYGDSGVYGPALQIRANSAVFLGSLSSQGRLVAEQLNEGDYLPVTDPIVATTQPYRPYLAGYFAQYWQDPTKTTFGADTAIPAITGVLPAKYGQLAIPLTGSLIYYIDLSISRLTGGGSLDNNRVFDIFYFIYSLNQAITWVTTSNDYINSINVAEDTNFAYYGSNNYQDLITGNFDKIKNSKSALAAIKNIGRLISTVPTGQFGTANAVAQTMLDNGLGFVNNFQIDLISQGVDLNNLYSDLYTSRITNSLSKITNQSDLLLIQKVLETTLPNISSPLDYTDISRSSGFSNDGVYARMQDIGREIYSIAPNLTFVLGSTFALMLENLRQDGVDQISSISTANSLLTPEIISSLRSYLPQNADNQTISVLNVIGAASGYLLEPMTKVNNGLAALYATKYGPQIRDLLELISRTNAKIAVTDQEITFAQSNPNYWTDLCTQYKEQYKSLLNTIVNDKDDNINYIVRLINDNYDFVCQQIYFETINYQKANFSNITAQQLALNGVNTNEIIFDFVTLLPFYGADSTNIGTDALLFGMAQNNTGGNLIKAILAQAKNNQLLGLAGVKTNFQ